MPTLDNHGLKYGFIYVFGNPKQTHNLRWFATMIEPMIRPLTLEWVETWDIDHTLIVARRFNVGNLGKFATVQLHLNPYGHSDTYSLLAAVHAFSDCLEDVMDDSEGDVIINERDFADRNQPPQGKWGESSASTPLSDILYQFELDLPQDHTRVERKAPEVYLPSTNKEREEESPAPESKKARERTSSFRARLKNLSKKYRNLVREDHEDDNLREKQERRLEEENERIQRELEERCLEEQHKRRLEEESSCAEPEAIAVDGNMSIDSTSTSEVDSDYASVPIDVEAEEVLEFQKIESEYERDMRDLRARIVAFIAKYHQDPHQMMTTLLEGKVLLGATPGHLLVNGDLKIVLPEYDEMEIKMPAMSRTLYILFMRLRKQGDSGIVLKNISQYHDDIIDIYGLVKPGANLDRVATSVDNLCDPLGESLHQNISRINRCIKNVITDKELAKQYIITGTKGEEYSIGLDPELMSLPRAVTDA